MRTLAGYEKAWGAEHKRPLDTRYNLTIIYKETSILKETIEHFKLIVEGYIKVLGPKHSETIKAFDQLEELRKLIEKKKKKKV